MCQLKILHNPGNVSATMQNNTQAASFHNRIACLVENVRNGTSLNMFLVNESITNCIGTIEASGSTAFMLIRDNTYSIPNIQLHAQELYNRELLNVSTTEDNEVCYNFTSLKPASVSLNCSIPSQHVTFVVNDIRVGTNSYLTFCEVELVACKIGFYGNNCSQKCGHCVDTMCDYETGACHSGCQKHWSGINCDEDECSCDGTGRKCIFTNRYSPLDGTQNKENVALGKEVNLSSTDIQSPESASYRYREGCLAVNGDRDGTLKYFRNNASIANCIGTDLSDENPKFTLNLGRNYSISEIIIHSRIDYEVNLLFASITVDGQLCSIISTIPMRAFSIPCSKNLTGQIVIVSKSTTSLTDLAEKKRFFLTFCEFEVWVCRRGYYGSKCNKECGHCLRAVCDPFTGECPSGCEEYWSGIKCDINNLTCACERIGNKCDFSTWYMPHYGSKNIVNVALGKEANLSSTFGQYGIYNFAHRQGCLAVNGNRGFETFVYKNASVVNCVNTGHMDESPTFTLNLGRKYTISKIVIYTQNNYVYRLLNASITVDDQLCYTFTVLQLTIECYTPLTGQIIILSKPPITLQNVDMESNYSLNICEFEVWACRPMFYGKDCENSCEHCKNGCHALNGSCLTAECEIGFYGFGCSDKCGRCMNTSCDLQTGHCPSGCEQYWADIKCQTQICPDGYYGTDCLQKCGACKEVKCELDGVCINGCRDGFTDDNCTTVKIIANPASIITLNKRMGVQIGVGVLIAGVVIALILFLIAEWRRRRGMSASQGFEIAEVMSIKSSRKGRRTHTTCSHVAGKTKVSIDGKEWKEIYEEGKQGLSEEYEWREGGQGWWERWWRGEESFGDTEEGLEGEECIGHDTTHSLQSIEK